MSDRDTYVREAMNEAERTQDGKPELADVNRILREANEPPISRSERDRVWAEMQAEGQSDQQDQLDHPADQPADQTATAEGRAEEGAREGSGEDNTAAMPRTVGPDGESPADATLVPQPAGQQNVPIRRADEDDAGLNPAPASYVEAKAPSNAPGAPERWEPPADTTMRVKVTSARTEPVILYVHGVGRYELALNQPYDLPAEAVDALRHSDVTFEEVEDR